MLTSRDSSARSIVVLSQLNGCKNYYFCTQILLFQRQSRLDEVTGRRGEFDALGGVPASQPPLTTPLERRDIPPQLSMTLEHIVGQLDVLTQV